MTNAVAVIGLLVGGTDVQDADFGIFLEIVRGLNEGPTVRGTDTTVPGLAGRIARNRIADTLTIELRGIVSGRGTAAAAVETASGTNTTLAADSAAGASVVKFPGVACATSAAADDIIDTATAHGFTAGQRVMFESITGGAGLTALTAYYVIAANLAATTLQVSATSGGAAIDFTTDITAGVLIPAFVAAQYQRIGATGETEIRKIATVGTSGSGGTGLTLTAPLLRPHASGGQVRQVDSYGSSGDAADFRANAKIIRALFDPTAAPATLVAALEDGTTATITARTLNTVWDQVDPTLANVSIELESVDPDWVIA